MYYKESKDILNELTQGVVFLGMIISKNESKSKGILR